MKYALKEPTGKFFKNPSYSGWDFTSDKNEATTFSTKEEAMEMKETIENAVAVTYWDYDDIVPFPKLVMV